MNETSDSAETYDTVKSLKKRQRLAKAFLFLSSPLPATIAAGAAAAHDSPAAIERAQQTPNQLSLELTKLLPAIETNVLVGSRAHHSFDNSPQKAFRITYHGKQYVLGSAHGVSGLTVDFSGSNNGSVTGVLKLPGNRALDFYKPNIEDVAFGPAANPKGYATGIAIAPNTDAALYKYQPAEAGDSFPSVDFSHMAEQRGQLKPGMAVAIDGTTDEHQPKPVEEAKYLGETRKDADGQTRPMFWVMVNEKLNLDFSGSPFLAETSKGIFVSGGASEIINKDSGSISTDHKLYQLSDELGINLLETKGEAVVGYQDISAALPEMVGAFGHSAFSH